MSSERICICIITRTTHTLLFDELKITQNLICYTTYWSWQFHRTHYSDLQRTIGVTAMVFNATFNKHSVVSWWSVLLVEETGVPGEKPPTCRKSLTNCMHTVFRVHFVWAGFELTTLVVIGAYAYVVVKPTTIRSLPRFPLWL